MLEKKLQNNEETCSYLQGNSAPVKPVLGDYSELTELMRA